MNLASQFIQSHLYNGSVVLEFINLAGCAVTKAEANIHETGLFVEGLSVYLNKTMNVTLQTTCVSQCVHAKMKTELLMFLPRQSERCGRLFHSIEDLDRCQWH